MDFQPAALAICGATLAYACYKRLRAFSINDIPGPENPSRIYGHMWWWQREGANIVEKNLLEEYGTVVRWNGALGEERLWIADPKAIRHLLRQDSSYRYENPPQTTTERENLLDRGLSWAEGDTHKRHRRAMTPAFGPVEAKAMYPCFSQWSNTLADKWHEAISNTESGQATVVNVASWLSRATLDAIGAGAFDYDFGALENTDNKLTKSYKNLAFNAFGRPSKGQIFVMDTLGWIPMCFTTWISKADRRHVMARLRENRAYVHEVAAKLVEEKRQEVKDGTSQRNVLTLFVKANSSPRPDSQLTYEELVAQVRTIIFAGHDTTARMLTLALWELANNPRVQGRLREEIVEKLGQIRSTGRDDFTVDDFDSMPYLLAVGKEILRVHPVASEIQRVSKEDTALPLTTPVIGVSGKAYKELLVPAGTFMNISLLGYNMNKDLWGPDPYEFRPERWFDITKKSESPFGVYSSLATFSGGARSCIGWRFAVIELHTFMVTLVGQFDFSLPEDAREVKWTRVNAPVVVGEEHKGPQLPLKVTVLGNE